MTDNPFLIVDFHMTDNNWHVEKQGHKNIDTGVYFIDNLKEEEMVMEKKGNFGKIFFICLIAVFMVCPPVFAQDCDFALSHDKDTFPVEGRNDDVGVDVTPDNCTW